MLPPGDLAAYAVVAGMIGSVLLKLDQWAHSPAALQRDIDSALKRLDRIDDRFDAGNERFSDHMGKANSKIDEVDSRLARIDLRLTRLEAFREMQDTPRPQDRSRD